MKICLSLLIAYHPVSFSLPLHSALSALQIDVRLRRRFSFFRFKTGCWTRARIGGRNGGGWSGARSVAVLSSLIKL